MISLNRSVLVVHHGGDLISFNLLDGRYLRSNLYTLALFPSTSSQFYANKMFSMHMNISHKPPVYA